MAKTRVYYQIQYVKDGSNVHSDGCGSINPETRQLWHDMLDEWLNNQPSSTDPELNSLYFRICTDHDKPQKE